MGGNTAIKYLVLQVHYMHKTTEPDFSGITIESTDQKYFCLSRDDLTHNAVVCSCRMPKTAATMLMVTGGGMAPHTKGEDRHARALYSIPY